MALGAIGLAVRASRLAHGWTLEELAGRAGLDVRHVQLVESGTANPTARTLLRLAHGLGVGPARFFAEPPAPERAESERTRDDPAREARRMTSRGSGEVSARRIRLLRLARGWSQAELADRVGLSTTAIQALEAGKKSPTLRTLDAIAHALTVEPWTLLTPLPDDGEPVRARAPRVRIGRTTTTESRSGEASGPRPDGRG
jgi:transcriptional regulator with XRE-family HTH domain